MQVSDLYFRLNTAAQALDSLIRHDDQFRGFLANSPAVISAHKTGAGEIDYLIAIPIAAGLSNTEIQSSLSSLLRQKSQPTQHVFEEQTIFSTESFLSDKPLHFFIDHQILVLSFSATLIESSVRALLNNQSVWSDALFRKLRETRGEQSRGQIYIQYAQFAELLQPFADKTHRNIPFFSAHFAKWSALDIRIDANAVLLNGFAAVSDSSNQWLSLFKGIPANSPIFFEYMPENTSFFAFFGFDNIANHLSRRQALWQDTSENQQLTLLQKTCQCDLKTLATGWIADRSNGCSIAPTSARRYQLC